MPSSNGNIFRETGHLWGETTGHRWIPLTKASDAKLWCFFIWSAPEQNGWANHRDADDLKRYRAHHDVTIIYDDFAAAVTVAAVVAATFPEIIL